MSKAEKYQKISELALRGESWLKRNANVEGIARCVPELSTELLRLANAASDGAAVMRTQPTIGVFGASQAGKSYLVNTLSSGGDRLTAQCGGITVDFMRDINPGGGDKEATGVVTRFSHASVSGIEGFPLRLRVFRVTEIVMILVNSFFSDFVMKPDTLEQAGALLSPVSFNSRFESIKTDPKLHLAEDEKGLGIVTAADVVALADYARNHSKGTLSTLKADGEFWLKARAIAPTLNVAGLTRLFSACWGDFAVFSRIFEKIATELFKLKGADTVFCGIDAFLGPDGKQYGEGTINSIKTLLRIFGETRRLRLAMVRDGQTEIAELDFAVAAAVTLEILFPLDGSSNLSQFDVLDFPGARGREQDAIENFLGKTPDQALLENSAQYLRRGKVAYLFDRYTEKRDVDVLLFCINASSQLEVTALVPLLDTWIERNVGATPQLRARLSRIPLVGVLTRFDEAMKKDADIVGRGLHSEANATVSGAFEHFKNCGWLNEWTSGRPHRQFFLVRRPGLCKELFEIDDDSREVALRPETAKFFPEFAQSFKSDDRCRHLFGSADEALEAVMKLNDGGASRIVSFISENFKSADEMRERITVNLESMTQKAESALGLYQSGSSPAAMSKATAGARSTVRALAQCQAVSRVLFSRMRALLELPDDELKGKYGENWSSGKNAARFALECVNALKTRIRGLTSGAGLAELAAAVNSGWKIEMPNAVSQPDARERYSFFYDESASRFLEPGNALSEHLGAVMRVYAGELEKAVSSLKLEERLRNALDENERNEDDKGMMAIRQTALAQYLISSAMVFLGKNESTEPPVLSRAELFGDDDTRALFTESVTFTQELDGAQRIATLPEVSGDFRRACADHVFEDHLTAWADLAAGLNLHAESPYKLSVSETNELNAIMTVFYELNKDDAE